MMQEQYAILTSWQHKAIHAEIAAVGLAIGVAEAVAYKKLGFRRKREVLKIAQTDEGRASIANALQLLYSAGWWEIIGPAFSASVGSYKDGSNTSLPSCTRSGAP